MTKYIKMHHKPRQIKHATEEEAVLKLNNYFDGLPFTDENNGSDEDANLVMRVLANDVISELFKSYEKSDDSAWCIAAQAAYCAMVLLGNRYVPKKPIHKSFYIDEGYLFWGWNKYRKIM